MKPNPKNFSEAFAFYFTESCRAITGLSILILIFAFSRYFLMKDFSMENINQSPVDILRVGFYILIMINIYFFTLVLVGHRAWGANQSYGQYLKAKITPLIADVTMAQAIILLFGLFLLIPGLYKILKYSFVPYIVLDKDTRAESINSLKYSNRLTRKLPTLLVLAVISVLFLPFQLLPELVPKDNFLLIIIISVVTVLGMAVQNCVHMAYYKTVESSL